MGNQPVVHVVNDAGELVVEIGSGSASPAVVVRPGCEYVVLPSNSCKKKHRGRVCIYLGLDFGRCFCGARLGDSEGWTFVITCARCGGENKTWEVGARVRFVDTGRVGVADAADLRPILLHGGIVGGIGAGV